MAAETALPCHVSEVAAARRPIRRRPPCATAPARCPSPVSQVALEISGMFNFQGNFSLISFVRGTVVEYLKDPSPQLRKAAAKACCHLTAQALDSASQAKGKPRTGLEKYTCIRLKTSDRQFMPHLLCSLLAVAVSDADADIRLAVLNSLEARFDPYLVFPECLRLLFMCLNDEAFTNRHAAIDIIGRLNRRNPSYIHTSFRVVLLQLINELEYTQDARKEEESALMLSKVIRAAPALMPPYAPRILQVMPPPPPLHGTVRIQGHEYPALGSLLRHYLRNVPV